MSQAIAVRYAVTIRLNGAESVFNYKGGFEYSLRAINNIKAHVERYGEIVVRDNLDRPIKLVVSDYDDFEITKVRRLPDDQQDKLIKLSVKTKRHNQRTFYAMTNLTEENYIRSLKEKLLEKGRIHLRYSITNKMTEITIDEFDDIETAFEVLEIADPYVAKDRVIFGQDRGILLKDKYNRRRQV